jgi:subtilisin family serine protease
MRYIVKTEKASYIKDLQKAVKGRVGAPRCMKCTVIVETDQHQSEIESIPGVVSVIADIKAQKDAVSQSSPGWGLASPGWGLEWISNTPGAYMNARTGQGVDIYVIDDGIRVTHTEFEGRIRTLWSFDGDPFKDGDSHGTAVASCAAGTLAGAAKLASIVNLRIDFWLSTVVKALDMIIHDHVTKNWQRPSIINFSASSDHPIFGELFEEAVNRGIVVVASAGNYAEPEPRYPAKNGWVNGVGALDDNGGPAWFTNRRVALYAPGVGVRVASDTSDTAFTTMNGTSFSAPYVAGLMACNLQGSHRFNHRMPISDFNFRFDREACDTDRIPPFNNFGYHIRTSATKNMGTFYASPGSQITDAEINAFIQANLENPPAIVDACLQYNIDLSRLVIATGFTETQIVRYCINNNLSPWWLTQQMVDDYGL